MSGGKLEVGPLPGQEADAANHPVMVSLMPVLLAMKKTLNKFEAPPSSIPTARLMCSWGTAEVRIPEYLTVGRNSIIKGFKNFLLRGDVIVIAIGLMVALAVSTLIKAFHRFHDQSIAEPCSG